jgi:NADH:ubiquinone oxidoreductase subunit 6 (subunit J)
MNKKISEYILMGVGAIILLISLTADMIGLGADPVNFGWKQILGAVVGVVIIIIGIVLLKTKKNPGQTEISQGDPKGIEED